ncbi:MAG: hypothetical protein QXE70_11085 [Ignisphaera sp.]
MSIKIYIFKCPVCGKTIASLSEIQVLTNANHHLAKHLLSLTTDELKKYVTVKVINSF